ncbi:MAG: DUF359 domain-containing protein [Methanobrevibacter sp.]|jgi:uncharacterized protein (UPF0218 family)|nr:DUF359 domain-containing protein [Candidatus Methanoflexus mossambicus]
MYLLTKELRQLLKSPVGKLYPEFDTAIPEISSFEFVISVGDVTTLNLIKNDLIPDLAIVDNFIQRDPHSETFNHTENVFYVENPPGTITTLLWETIDEAIRLSIEGNKQLIVVKGEEDLAVLPCIVMAPDDSIVLYGQPNEGLVIAKTLENKEKAQNFMDMMIEK